jgi:hypothetical protein
MHNSICTMGTSAALRVWQVLMATMTVTPDSPWTCDVKRSTLAAGLAG